MRIDVDQLRKLIRETYSPEGMSDMEPGPLHARLSGTFERVLAAVVQHPGALENEELTSALDDLEEVIDSIVAA